MLRATIIAAFVLMPVVTGAPAVAEDKAVPGKEAFLACRKLPPNKPVLKMKLTPEVKLADFVRFITTITCNAISLGAHVTGHEVLRVTVPERLISGEEAYDLFVASLEAAGLIIETHGKSLRVVHARR